MRPKLTALLLALSLSASLAYATSWRTIRVSVGTVSASEIGNKAGRLKYCFKNTDATNPIYCGPTSGVTSATGTPYAAGDRQCIEGPDAALPIYCIATGGTVAVGGREAVQ